MAVIDQEFDQTLAQVRERRGGPERELEHLLLLALEREQLVTVAYRNDLMSARLEEAALAPGLARVFRQSLAWAWKDEQMHAVYTRGLLFRRGRPLVRARALVQQLAGALGGWASSIQQHVPWSRAPVSRAMASFVAVVGRVGGKVPKAVRNELRLLSFEDFCRLQVGAEHTAAACWKRLTELVTSIPSIDQLHALGARAHVAGRGIAPPCLRDHRRLPRAQGILPDCRRGAPRGSRPSATGSTFTLTSTPSSLAGAGPAMIASFPSPTSIPRRPRGCSATKSSPSSCARS